MIISVDICSPRVGLGESGHGDAAYAERFGQRLSHNAVEL